MIGIGHIKLCLEEIEAEIDAVDYAVVGARARELLAGHIEGIRLIAETIEAASPQDIPVAAMALAEPAHMEPSPAMAAVLPLRDMAA